MRQVTFAATQFACSWDLPQNADRAEALVRQAAAQGAGVVLVQELFATPYFCIEQRPEYFALAAPMQGHPLIARFADLARELGVVLPCSYFEKAGQAHFNSCAMIDADGRVLATFDLDAVATLRGSWGLFRDRRTELYGLLQGLDGQG